MSAWYPLLRQLHAAGWEHARVLGSRLEHVWERNRHALNHQKISLDQGVVSINIHGVDLSGAGLTPDQCHLILTILGAFDPAPEPVWRHTEAIDKAAREALLTMAACDNDMSDDVFNLLARAIDGRPL